VFGYTDCHVGGVVNPKSTATIIYATRFPGQLVATAPAKEAEAFASVLAEVGYDGPGAECDGLCRRCVACRTVGAAD
jgi:hypothetical protein